MTQIINPESNYLVAHRGYGDAVLYGYTVSPIVIDKSVTTHVFISSLEEFNGYTCTEENGLMGNGVPVAAVKEFRVGGQVTFGPDNLLRYAKNLDTFSFTENGKLISIGQYSLANCDIFNQAISIPEGVTSCGSYFLCNSQNFDSVITLPSTIGSMGNDFLTNASRFNKPISIPNGITLVPADFLRGCTSFNSAITLPNTLTNIGPYFLDGCISFNTAITLPNSLTAIGTTASCSFMNGCTAFSKTLEIPSGCTVYRNQFMHDCDNFTSLVANGTFYTGSGNAAGTLATSSSSAPMYTTGVTITGANRASWIAELPNRTSSPYRKLIDGGA